jgi:anti-sigma-K factor RskA
LNIKEYISSGILEAYALGDISDRERSEVEANLLRYPELKEELLKIEEAQEAFLLRNAVAPPSRVKYNLMSEIENLEKSAAPSSFTQESKVIPIRPDDSVKYWKFATAASVSIAVLASYLAFNYRGQLNDTRQSLNNLIAQNRQMAQDYNVVNQRLDKIENTLKVTDNPAFKRIVLKGTEASQNALASVYWDENTSEVYLSIQNLRELSKDQQFQLWAIVDGKPVDAGVFSLTADLMKMKDVQKASAFAVTIEPVGGSVSPTLSSMQVIGTI